MINKNFWGEPFAIGYISGMATVACFLFGCWIAESSMKQVIKVEPEVLIKLDENPTIVAPSTIATDEQVFKTVAWLTWRIESSWGEQVNHPWNKALRDTAAKMLYDNRLTAKEWLIVQEQYVITMKQIKGYDDLGRKAAKSDIKDNMFHKTPLQLPDWRKRVVDEAKATEARYGNLGISESPDTTIEQLRARIRQLESNPPEKE